MVGPKLKKELEAEIKNYLGLPYFANSKDNPNQRLAVQVGKGNWQQIKKYTAALAKKQKINLSKLNPQQLYNFQKKNHIGLDCSGLAYHLSDKLYQLKFKKTIRPHLIGTENKTGPRRISSNLLTSPKNAIPVKSFDQIQTGDLIRSDLGRHVLFVIKKINNKIYYVHSSKKTKQRQVHQDIITIKSPPKPLNQQLWPEKTLKNKPYHQHFYPQYGDGIFRLKCLT